jgi:hypothetical protein
MSCLPRFAPAKMSLELMDPPSFTMMKLCWGGAGGCALPLPIPRKKFMLACLFFMRMLLP